MERTRGPLALSLALPEPQPYLVQDWPKGQGTWKPQKSNAMPIKSLSTSRPLKQISENLFSEAIAKNLTPTSYRGAGFSGNKSIQTTFYKRQTATEKRTDQSLLGAEWGGTVPARGAQVLFSKLMVLHEFVQTHRTLPPRVTPKVIIFYCI